MNNYSRRVGIVGFRGYSGAELVRILTRHSSVTPVLLEHRVDAPADPTPLNTRSLETIPATAESVRDNRLDLILLATPAGVSMDLTPGFLQTGTRVIDLSGAFRLPTAESYRAWYHEEHSAPELLSEAVYGLPEFYRDRIKTASLVANPGCYPTAANLVLQPLLAAGAVDRASGIICDAKSGVSGAGRKPSLKTSFGEAGDNFSAYGFADHRHVPEVLQHSGLRADEFTFTAQLLPLYRGILETIYIRMTPSIATEADLLKVFQNRYDREPFVRLYAPRQTPDLHAVQNTNFCDIGFHFHPGTRRATVVVAEDNLIKGAAGQAVQNLNLMLGFNESEALL